MVCSRFAVSTFLLLIWAIAQPVRSWEPTDNWRNQGLRGFSNSAEVSANSAGRRLTQSSDLAAGTTYNIQSKGRLGSCWSYLSIPKCGDGDTADLYTKDDGSGRQQWQLVSAGGNNLFYLVLKNGRSGCTNWLSGQPCPENRVSAWYTDDSSGRQKWLLSPLGDHTYTISLPQGRSSCGAYLSSSGCNNNAATGCGFTSFVGSDSGSGFERWLITSVSASASSTPSVPSPTSPSKSSGGSTPQPTPMSGTSSSARATSSSAVAGTQGCGGGKKGVVYDFFFQYCPSVLVTNSAHWINFDSGFDSSCTDPQVVARHQPMVWGTDRIDSSYAAISSLANKPPYLLTFNEPNYAFGGGSPSNIVDPVTAAGLWPRLMSKFVPMGIQLIAPSPIDCAGDGNCHNVGTAAGWLTQFRDTLNKNTPGAWDAIHALNYHTYAKDLGSIQSATSKLHQQFGKPIWITEIAAGGGASMDANIALMEAFVPWANSQSWIERYFWNQATPTPGNDPNIQNSYLVNKSKGGGGDGSLSALGRVYAKYQC
ncbi:hypothetical protein ABBQ32_000496 [Trebouxia sp. C0010 RCD-2024]